jgi:hypothetical protein
MNTKNNDGKNVNHNKQPTIGIKPIFVSLQKQENNKSFCRYFCIDCNNCIKSITQTN